MNIRSILRNLQYFKDLIIYDSSVSLNVIGFTEVRLGAHHSSLYDIPGYLLFTNPRNIHGGGTALYVSERYVSHVQINITVSECCI